MSITITADSLRDLVYDLALLAENQRLTAELDAAVKRAEALPSAELLAARHTESEAGS